MAGARFMDSRRRLSALDWELFDRKNRNPPTIQRSFHRGCRDPAALALPAPRRRRQPLESSDEDRRQLPD